MDYGPTIAAAFGSNNPKEVDDLREALVACMRNTPLNGGIRATGAVRERTDPGYEQHAQCKCGNEADAMAIWNQILIILSSTPWTSFCFAADRGPGGGKNKQLPAICVTPFFVSTRMSTSLSFSL